MSGDSTEATAQIESELLDEMSRELRRRGTTVRRKREPDEDLLGSFVVTAMLTCLALLGGTGIAMAMVYTPSVDDASASTAWFEQGTLGGLVRAVHYHASNLLVLLGACYLAYMAWRGLYRRPYHRRWWRGALMLLLALAFGFTGMLLPYDQLALHGTDIRLGYIAEVPVIGAYLRGWLQGGEQVGTATLSRFFGLHAILLPATTLILLRWLWRDARAGAGFTTQIGVAGAVAVVLVLVSGVFHAPLGLTGNLDEPFPEARPEWYALPLYAVMKFVPGGAGAVAALVIPPLLGTAVVVGLPMLETAADSPARYLKAVRIGLIATAVAMGALAAVPLYQDSAAGAGWFKIHDDEEIMTAMGERNERLGNSAAPLPNDAHVLARDMGVLFDRLEGRYPEDIKGGPDADWDRWVRDGRKAVQTLWLAGDSDTQVEARKAIREACQGCHDAQDQEDVVLNPPLSVVPVEPEPELEFFFDMERLETLEPVKLEREDHTSRVMEAMKLRTRDILSHAGISEAPATLNREQALVDLRHLVEVVSGLFPVNEGDYFYPENWDEWSGHLRDAVAKLDTARTPEDVGRIMAEAGQACDDCHEGADDPTEPIEWRYRSLLR